MGAKRWVVGAGCWVVRVAGAAGWGVCWRLCCLHALRAVPCAHEGGGGVLACPCGLLLVQVDWPCCLSAGAIAAPLLVAPGPGCKEASVKEHTWGQRMDELGAPFDIITACGGMGLRSCQSP